MAHDRSEVHLAADLSAPPAHALEASAFRVAIFGDFSGRAGATAGAPIAERRALRVDRDDVDAVLARLAPEVRIVVDPNEPPLVVTFSSLEDFHPDQLMRLLPLFQRLRALRAEVEASPPAPASPAPARAAERAEAVAADLSGGSLLDRIVEHAQAGSDAPTGQRPAAPRDDLADFVARAVHSHMVAESSPQQRSLAAKVDEVIAATMRVVLHHPRFQALEALWRGVDFLVRRLETSESMQVYLIDVARDELAADLSALHALVVDVPGMPRGERAWSLLVGAYTFEPGDASLLSSLAGLGRMAGAPWLAAAHSKFFGLESFAGADPDDWTLQRPAAWESMRASPQAPFLALAAPRFLLRLPYGRRGEECESFAFEELDAGSSNQASCLWGNPAFACALTIADSVAAGDPPATRGTIERLPLYVAPVDGEPTATPCAEMLLTQRAVEEMLDAGITALVSPRDADTIVIPRIQSVASPLRSLSVPSTNT